jgi:hypothetical protein
MHVIHIARSTKAYYLHVLQRKNGKPNYYFSTDASGPLADGIPPGYEIYEDIRGRVFLRRQPPRIITDEEMQVVQSALRVRPDAWRYRPEIMKHLIVVHEAGGDPTFFKELVPWCSEERLTELLVRFAHYVAVLRFILVDRSQRLFAVERYCFRGSIDRWTSIGYESPAALSLLVKLYVKHLGQESFYDLM